MCSKQEPCRFLHNSLTAAESTLPIGPESSMKRQSSPQPQPPPAATHSTPLLQFYFRVDIHYMKCSVFLLHNSPWISFTFHHRNACCDSRLMQEQCGPACPLPRGRKDGRRSVKDGDASVVSVSPFHTSPLYPFCCDRDRSRAHDRFLHWIRSMKSPSHHELQARQAYWACPG